MHSISSHTSINTLERGNNPQQRLLDAILENNYEEIERSLREGADINQKTEDHISSKR